jgi:predicted ArsR family transcriptional regulator
MDDVESIGALAEPVRRALYEWVVGQAAPVSRDQAAAGAGVPRHTAKFHLDKLVADGLLETEFRRLTGRRGPGAGRPAKLYRRSPREVAVTLPPRRYELAARIMAAALDRGGAPEALAAAAADVGRRAGATLESLLAGSDRRAVLDPAPGRCCVTVVGDDSGRPPGSTPA